MQYWNNFVTNISAHMADDFTQGILAGCVLTIVALITVDKLMSKGA